MSGWKPTFNWMVRSFQYVTKDGVRRRISAVGQEELGLTDSQAERLFNAPGKKQLNVD
jgi:hypothetical protein